MAKPYNDHNANGGEDDCAPSGDSIPMSLARSTVQSARNITAVLSGRRIEKSIRSVADIAPIRNLELVTRYFYAERALRAPIGCAVRLSGPAAHAPYSEVISMDAKQGLRRVS